MKKYSRRFLNKISIGAMTGLLAYFVLLLIRSPVEEIIAAFFIGLIPEIVERKDFLIFIYALSCSAGWIAGLLFFGMYLELGLGAWIMAGACLGFTSGIVHGSFLRGTAGLLLGVLAGLLAEASRYATILSHGLRLLDMQLIVLVAAGILLPLAATVVSKPQKKITMAVHCRFKRRDFLKSLGGLPLLFSSKAGPDLPFSWIRSHPRRPSEKCFVQKGRSLLVIVEGWDLKKMLEAGLNALPGFEKALKNKKNIVLKPNATASQSYPVTTDSDFLRELIVKIKALSNGRITLLDSSSYAGLTAYRVFSKLGYFNLGREQGIRALSIDPTLGSYFVRVSDLHWKRNPSLLTNKAVQESDFVINLPVAKRHHAADFTCSLKNNFGCTYDTFRMLAHARSSGKGESGSEFFDQSLVEFADAVRPELTIVDARSLLIKSGPTYDPGKSEIKDGVNRLILSGDMVAADSYCANLMQEYDETFQKEKRVDRQLEYARHLGLGTKDLNQVETVEIAV
ncbi:MAG: DUF362 domain-containing protein [Clostridiales bacterium]|nr:DUF362 domain-containing protein [Clostridiales bacterium]